jgi:uncharacterized protein YcbK (DUF882 family)
MSTRFALIIAAVLALLTWLPGEAYLEPVQAGVSPFKYTGDGKLALFDAQTGESVTIVYRDKNGVYEDAALDAIDHLLRCHGKGEEFPISQKLVELVDHLQDHFGADKVSIVSGYRSPEYNEHIRRTLGRVAHDSQHLRGMAMDILLPGVTKQQLTSYAESLKSGGVGDYANSRYVHVDVGQARRW